MKFKMKATVIFEWEEDSDSWPRASGKDDLIKQVKEYAENDPAYVLETDVKSMILEAIT